MSGKIRNQRLQPLLDALQPNQRNDPRRPERRLEGQMDQGEALIFNAFSRACDFDREEQRLDLQRRDFRKFNNVLHNLMQRYETEVQMIERQP